jgi:hypothetical protein
VLLALFGAIWAYGFSSFVTGPRHGHATASHPTMAGAIAAAHGAVATANAASVAHGGTIASRASGTKPAAASATASAPATSTKRAGSAAASTSTHPSGAAHAHRVTHRSGAAHHTQAANRSRASAHHVVVRVHRHAVSPPLSPAARLRAVRQALAHHRVVALLFVNPAASDDQAVGAELAAVSVPTGRVLKLTVPLSELSRYSAIIRQVPVSGSPTLVIIDRTRQAQVVVGFADRYEIAQRINAALAS